MLQTSRQSINKNDRIAKKQHKINQKLIVNHQKVDSKIDKANHSIK